MHYADDEDVVSKSGEGLTKILSAIVIVFEAAGLKLSEKQNGDHDAAETRYLASRASPFVIEGRRKQV